SGEEDVVVGTPVAGRSRAELEGLVGLFVNTIPLRADLSGRPSFRELLRRTRAATLSAFAHQDLPLDRLVDELKVERSLAHAPLFQVLFTFRVAAREALSLGEARVEAWNGGEEGAKFDLALEAMDEEGRFTGALAYRASLFRPETVERMAAHLRALLAAAVDTPDAPARELPILGAAERELLVRGWNATDARHPEHGCVHELFEAQVRRTPGAVALEAGDERVTYAELDGLASLLAARLRALGVGPESRVGICAERTPELVTAVLATLRAGGAYVPLDPAYPAERLRFLAVDAGVRLVLVTAPLRDRVPPGVEAVLVAADAPLPRPLPHEGGGEQDGTWIPYGASAAYDTTVLSALPQNWGRVASLSEPGGGALSRDSLEGRQALTPDPSPNSGGGENDSASVSPDNLAYVIHTSGSTGTPKGVMVTHRGFANLLLGTRALFGFAPGDVVPALASPSFDIWGFEVLGPLLAGATVRLVPAGRVTDPDALAEEAARATVLHAVPALMRQVAASGAPSRALRWAFTGGDTVPPELPAEVRERFPGAAVAVLYGPTEGTVLASTYAVPAGERTTGHPIGRPLPNVRLYVCDGSLEPAPVGVAGELLIGGAGVARGYLGRPDLTAEKFVPDPFAERGGGGARLYRTGDRVRRRTDGVLEFLGRTDGQVKVRGFRIEPGEVESVLEGHSSVREALVVVREDAPGARRLVAYTTPAGGALPDPDELRAHLRARLPEHMVPSAFVALDRLPLSANGKVDRRALPAPEQPAADGGSYTAARSPAEEALARVWAELLGLERIGVDDDFFEAGGDSILAIQMVARARRAGVEVTPRQLFQHPTVAALARVAGVSATGTVDAEVAPGELPLTPVQHRFFEQDLPDRHHWNQALLLAPRERLDAAVLERALREVVEHHDAFRLRFARGADGWRQRYADSAGEVALERVDLAALPTEERPAALEAAAAKLHAGLHLENGPLLRAALLDLGPAGERLLLVAHHLVVDGVSWRILGEDLQDAYRTIQGGGPAALPAKTASLREWAERLEAHARSATLGAEAEFWASPELHGAAPLPVDLPGGDDLAASAAEVTVSLDAGETWTLLHDVPAAYRVRVDDVLLTALARTLADWTGERRVAVELESHGREDLFPGTDVSRTVGWFTSVYPVVLDLRGAYGDGAELRAVKEQLRQVPHHGIGHGVLRHLSPDAELRRRLRALPAPGVAFQYLGQLDASASGALFALADEPTGPNRAGGGEREHLLEVAAMVRSGALHLRWEYGSRAHLPETVRRLASRCLAELRALIAHCASGEEAGYTPSDFPLADLDEATLAMLEEDFL
ncbi:MAG: amino acid adenylation domain-containing protein, partial [Gemmatimonadetes bacterium]|nr:amino acid adenylation domain-containing protein [Gemmatimonadota bacterium]